MTVYIGTNRNDKLTGLDDVSDDFTGGLGNDLLIGGGGKGFDWAHYDSAPSAVTVNLATGIVSGGDGNDRLNGIEGVTGSAYNDTLTGRSDTYSELWGGKGDDLLIGGDGGASLRGGSGNDILQGGKSWDWAYYDDSSSSVTVNLSKGTAIGGGGNDTLSGIEGVFGSNYNDTLTGNDLDNSIEGWSGNDVLIGGKGYDTLSGSDGKDMLQGGDDADSLYGGSGNDVLQGGDGDDWLDGGSGNDLLLGGAGNDTLLEGDGNDKLTGGTGIDNFVFWSNPAVSIDTITDFSVVDDTIQLDNYIFAALKTEGTLSAGKFVIGTQALDANDFIIYNDMTGALLYDADGSGGGASVPIAIVGTGLAMTHSDIVVI